MKQFTGVALLLLTCSTSWVPATADASADATAQLLARVQALEHEVERVHALEEEVTTLRAAQTVSRKLSSTKSNTAKGFGNRRVPGKARVAPKQDEGRELTVLDLATLASNVDGYVADLQGALNHMWLILCGALVMLMQAGFAMLESGACRSKNAQNLLMKNLADLTVGTLCWWSFGWMFAYGADEEDPSSFAGSKQYFGDSFFEDVTSDGTHVPTDLPLAWFFQWAFCGAAATIVSGGVAERINFHAYAIYSVFLTAVVYPVVVYWTWSGSGWLYGGEDSITDIGYYDFAGSGIVHMTGGIGALCGAVVLGPRLGRFSGDANAEDEFAPHNVPLLVLGTFILWFGWYGFNCGSTLGLADTATGQLAAHVAMNTTIAAATGGITVLLLRLVQLKRYDVGAMCNGILAGLVSITAGCGNVTNWSAFALAIIGGIIYFGASNLLKLLKIDDPLDAFPVHGACGAWGALAAVIFDMGKGFDFFNGWSGFSCEVDESGACYSGGWTSAFGAQVIGILCIILWVSATSLLVMIPMRVAGIMKASDEIQEKGMDQAKHSPSKAYVA